MKRMKMAVAGLAHSHARSYLRELSAMADVEVVGLYDDDGTRRDDYARRFGVPAFETLQELLETEAAAVVVCSENALHARFVEAAAEAGKHVLCEKPLGISLGEMKRMIETCRRHGVQLMTAYPCRYLPSVAEAKAAVDRGDIGDVVAVKATNRGRRPGGWFVRKQLSGGGAVLDHTVHVLDLMRWMLRSEPVEVYAEVGALFDRTGEIDDAGIVHVRFANGTNAVLDPSWSRSSSFPAGGDVTLQLIGTKGVLELDALGQTNELCSEASGKTVRAYWGDPMDGPMLRAFIEAVHGGKPVPVTGEDGLRSAAVALAAYEAAERGMPVRIEL